MRASDYICANAGYVLGLLGLLPELAEDVEEHDEKHEKERYHQHCGRAAVVRERARKRETGREREEREKTASDRKVSTCAGC